MGKLILLSFADSKFRPTGERLRNEAEIFGLFDSILIPSEKDFGIRYRKKYWFRLKQKGMGYWMWKSYLVKRTYESLNDDDILFYIDAGCVLNKEGINRFRDYINEVRSSNSGILAFQMKLKERAYSKADLISFLNLEEDEILNSGQLYAGCFFIRKGIVGDMFVSQWFDICHNHFDLLSDSPSRKTNDLEFVCHKFDQSVFSLLAKQYNPTIHSADETYSSDGWSKLKDYPIQARRLKVYSPAYKWIHKISYPSRLLLDYMVKHRIVSFH